MNYFVPPVKKKRARIIGHNLLVPKSGNAPMLFLEWIADNGQINNLLYRIWNSPGHDFFRVRLNAHLSATKEHCRSYINANL